MGLKGEYDFCILVVSLLILALQVREKAPRASGGRQAPRIKESTRLARAKSRSCNC